MIARTDTKYQIIQNRRKTTYSNNSKAKFSAGNITINYKKTISNYTRDGGTKIVTSYNSANRIGVIKISINSNDVNIPDGFYIDNLQNSFDISNLQGSISIAQLNKIPEVDTSDLDFPLPISLSIYARVASGTGNTVGLHKDIEVSGFIECP